MSENRYRQFKGNRWYCTCGKRGSNQTVVLHMWQNVSPLYTELGLKDAAEEQSKAAPKMPLFYVQLFDLLGYKYLAEIRSFLTLLLFSKNQCVFNLQHFNFFLLKLQTDIKANFVFLSHSQKIVLLIQNSFFNVWTDERALNRNRFKKFFADGFIKQLF